MSFHSTFTTLLLTFSLASARSLNIPGGKLSTRQGQGQCVSEAGQPDWYNRNLNTVRAIYDLTVYPNNIPILMAGGQAVPPGLFAEHATGRVSPVGDFEDFEDSIEYFFALAPTPFTNNASTAFYDSQVVDFVSGCADVAASLVYFRTGSVDPLTGQLDQSRPVSTLSQVAFWRFDQSGAVEKYQAWVPNLQAWTRASSGIDYTSTQVQTGAAAALCPVIQQRCTGADQQFSTVQDCTQQLSAKPFGNFDEAWGDNIACRTIHIILTMVRPDVHCPHVGPSGGGKCVDVDYSTDYFDDERLFRSPLGSVFTCSGPLQPDNQVGAGPGAAQILQGLAQAAASGMLPGMPGMVGAGGAVGGAAGAAPGVGGTASGATGQQQQQQQQQSGSAANAAAQAAPHSGAGMAPRPQAFGQGATPAGAGERDAAAHPKGYGAEPPSYAKGS
ncbi:hypothetical protein PRZ48_011648 [Zasmidium cellare]|uniref:Uncharacterized protein n=1 Tax=Zasmidium cellare TaxID=395010 RepID=A0ABR0E7G2_ZASCE|nr:hypothetical protein PRZ48_011648 [Zasmidium cellare]